MQKIMFNDRYGLTEAVLKGIKTQTRRIVQLDDYDKECIGTPAWNIRKLSIVTNSAKYHEGEVVAIAQSYEKLKKSDTDKYSGYTGCPSYTNKMFVKAELMPHRIQILDRKLERLQDISDNDCLREGIVEDCPGVTYSFPSNGKQTSFDTPRKAYAALIDEISGTGTWDKNPWVLKYDFRLVK